MEGLSQFIADGEIQNCEYINVESEFSALSALVGSSAVGARCYSATTSQGLELMHEVLFNVSGMRMPIVMTVVNRAVAHPSISGTIIRMQYLREIPVDTIVCRGPAGSS